MTFVLTVSSIVFLNSLYFALVIVKPAACLCHQNTSNKSFIDSRTSTMSIYSGHLRLATSLFHSSLRTIAILLWASANLDAINHSIQCSISLESYIITLELGLILQFAFRMNFSVLVFLFVLRFSISSSASSRLSSQARSTLRALYGVSILPAAFNLGPT